MLAGLVLGGIVKCVFCVYLECGHAVSLFLGEG